MAHMRNAEAKLKAAVVDRLLSAGVLDADSVLVSELTVANWGHRTDMVLANGRLWGFELKSDRDSLDRLPCQLRAFSNLFEKLIVVVAEKFEAKAALLVQEVEGAGLWIAKRSGEIVERVRPKTTALKPEGAISLMTAEELRALLRTHGTKGLRSHSRAELAQLAMELPAMTLAEGARNAIKERFRNVHARFIDAQAKAGTLEALPLLTRNPTKTKSKLLAGTVQRSDSALPEVPLDHPNIFMAPSGPVIARSVR